MEKKIAHLLILVNLLNLAAIADQAHAFEQTAFMETAGVTTQPIGHYYYCQRHKSDCSIRASNTTPPKLTQPRWNDLVEVNAISNNTVKPMTDLQAYNIEELWVYPETYGDCEDYALMKRHLLMQRGWSASSLLITVVRQPNGNGHAVLTARTNKGDFILDNLNKKIQKWNETGYIFLKRQAENHSGKWNSIKDYRS